VILTTKLKLAIAARSNRHKKESFMGKANWSTIDHDGEGSSIGVRTADLNAGNIATALANIATLQTALQAVTLVGFTKLDVLAQTTTIGDPQPSADGNAQRETKFLVSGTDTAGFSTTIEIPGADLTLLPTGSATLDLSAGAGLALKNALQAVWVSKQGNAVTVNRVMHVSRNI
jgi:hypothetical protein